jgi:hypothetical protein
LETCDVTSGLSSELPTSKLFEVGLNSFGPVSKLIDGAAGDALNDEGDDDDDDDVDDDENANGDVTEGRGCVDSHCDDDDDNDDVENVGVESIKLSKVSGVREVWYPETEVQLSLTTVG